VILIIIVKINNRYISNVYLLNLNSNNNNYYYSNYNSNNIFVPIVFLFLKVNYIKNNN